ncbi:C-type lectin domain family 4 member G-like [Antedon mediterranea]|uniref:C-type lectin domain family 4 member G-like n=1 Tax=Antedon mediterranea TaxID=105859 RepID=UPI003AF8C257
MTLSTNIVMLLCLTYTLHTSETLETLLETKHNEDCPTNWITHGQNCYQYFKKNVEWETARANCKGYGADLVVIEDSAENHFVDKLTNVKKWIGLHRDREGRFAWVTHERSTYTKYAKDEPNNWKGDEDCVMMYKSGEWNDRKCNLKLAYVCEKLTHFGEA